MLQTDTLFPEIHVYWDDLLYDEKEPMISSSIWDEMRVCCTVPTQVIQPNNLFLTHHCHTHSHSNHELAMPVGQEQCYSPQTYKPELKWEEYHIKPQSPHHMGIVSSPQYITFEFETGMRKSGKEKKPLGIMKPRKTRKEPRKLPDEATSILHKWFNTHISHPYPTGAEKNKLMELTGLSKTQIKNWFVNHRTRSVHKVTRPEKN